MLGTSTTSLSWMAGNVLFTSAYKNIKWGNASFCLKTDLLFRLLYRYRSFRLAALHVSFFAADPY